MKLSNLLSEEAILQLKEAPDKWGVIRKLVEAVSRTPFGRELSPELKEKFLREIEEREKAGTTALGEGVAFPHARVEGIERPLIAFAAIPGGVDFGAPDGKPVNLVFLFLFPARRVELGIKIHAGCSRFLVRPEIREALLRAQSPEEIHRIFAENEVEIDAPIIAVDLMRPRRFRLTADMPLQQATRLMHRHRTPAAPVVDDDERVVGELNCQNIFERELPDYIKHLHSVPHIADFRPFRDYFSDGAAKTVGDFMNDCSEAVVQEDASLLEIIFLLSVKKFPLVYVCRDRRLIGVIDLVTVVDKVFNL